MIYIHNEPIVINFTCELIITTMSQDEMEEFINEACGLILYYQQNFDVSHLTKMFIPIRPESLTLKKRDSLLLIQNEHFSEWYIQ